MQTICGGNIMPTMLVALVALATIGIAKALQPVKAPLPGPGTHEMRKVVL